MLFSGSPGTGKTLTAESIADLLRLPLYSVDASQLGDTTEEIERKLRSVFRLVASWEAVLLLDEADVFMGKRVNDLQAIKSNQRVAGKLKVPGIVLKSC
jgi:SpoVK/Ycf46/Vps4 family AAA+-type ATPase